MKFIFFVDNRKIYKSNSLKNTAKSLEIKFLEKGAAQREKKFKFLMF